VFGITMKY